MASNNTLGTVTVLERESIGSKQQVTALVSVGANYPTGGKPITASQFGLDSIDVFQVTEPFSLSTTWRSAKYDHTNVKLMAFVEDGTSGVTAEAADDSDQSVLVCTVVIRGY